MPMVGAIMLLASAIVAVARYVSRIEKNLSAVEK